VFGVFDQQEPLPSDYGSPGGDSSTLSNLAPGEGALPKGYGAAKADAAQPSQVVKDISAFAKGVTSAVQAAGGTSSAFQSSGKASAPVVVAETSAPASGADPSKKWKIVAALALSTAVVGGTLWYGTKQGWFSPKEGP
jgi:hypothetical protein